jgi:hypothetical protein
MKKNDFVKTKVAVEGLHGTIPAGTIFQVLRTNPAKTLVSLEQWNGKESIQVHPDEVEITSRAEADIADVRQEIAKYRAQVAKNQADWDRTDPNPPNVEADRWGNKPGNIRWYWTSWQKQWVEQQRQELRQEWIDEQENVIKRIRLAASVLDYKRWDGNKIWFKANEDGTDMKRITDAFKDDLPKGVQFAAQAKVWW